MTNSGGGSVVNITSTSGLRANAGRSAYGSSKASVELLSKIMDAAAKDCFKSDIMKRVDR
ncbi:SDR family NAD(P)-dependent oxidoreductase [Rhizobium leguminosarum]